MTVLKAVGSYVLMTIFTFAFLLWFFDKPQEHDTLIIVLTAFFASASACGIIEDASSDTQQEKQVNAVITAVVTAGFWVWLFYDGYNDLAEMFPNDKIVAAVGTVMDSWEYLLIAVISFVTIISSAKKS